MKSDNSCNAWGWKMTRFLLVANQIKKEQITLGDISTTKTTKINAT
jgi:hypothetical protein